MLPIAGWTLKIRKWSTLWWVIGVSAFIFVTLIFYPTIRNQTGQLDQSFNNLPQSAKSLFTDTQDLFSPIGYLSSQVFYLMLPMLLAVLSIGLGSSLIAKEESDGTIELLLSRPISRGRLVAGKGIAGLVITAVVGLAATSAVILMCWAINMNVGLVNVLITGIYATVLAMLFGSIAFWVASLGRLGRGASIGVAALIALGGYIISSLVSMVSWLKWPAKVSPTHYYRPGEMLAGQYEWKPLAVFVVIILAFGLLAWLSFRRRDLLGG